MLKKVVLILMFCFLSFLPVSANKGIEELKKDVKIVEGEIVGLATKGENEDKINVISKPYALMYWQRKEKEENKHYKELVNGFIKKTYDLIGDIENYVRKDLRLSYGGDGRQIESLKNRETKCYGITLLVQDILKKEGVESQVLILGYSKSGKYKLPIKIYNSRRKRDEILYTPGHALLLIHGKDNIRVINPTSFLENYAGEEIKNKNKTEAILKVLLHHNSKNKFLEEPDVVTALLLPSLNKKTWTYYEMPYKNVVNYYNNLHTIKFDK